MSQTPNQQGASGTESYVHQAEGYTREQPTQALGIAFLAGLVLTILPVGSILGGLVRLAMTLLRPALVIFGAIKLYEEFNKNQQAKS